MRAAYLIVSCFRRGGKLLVCGNGGSAADAQHFVAEFVGRFKDEGRPALPAIAPKADSAVLTAWSNDVAYDSVFARECGGAGAARGRPGGDQHQRPLPPALAGARGDGQRPPRPSPIKPTPGGPRDSRRTGRRGVLRTMSNMRELYALTNPQHVLHRRRPLEAVTSVLPASPPGSRFPKHGRARRKGGRPGAPFYDSASPCGQAYARHRNDGGGLSWGSYRGRR